MGSWRGDFAAGGSSDADIPEEPDPSDLELVVELDDEFDEERLAETEPNSAASGSETIDADDSVQPLIGRLPRTLRVAGAVAVAAVLAFTVWPSPGSRRGLPQPTPTPSQVGADLYKVRLGSTSLNDAGNGEATLGLELTNSSATRLSVVSAALWDAAGTRLGWAADWPAQDLGGASTTSVPVTLPYSCNEEASPVLPMTIRYSISAPQDPSAQHDYAYPLSDTLWDDYTRARIAACARAGFAVDASGDKVDVTGIDTTQPIGAPNDPQGFDLTFTMEASGIATWNVDGLTAPQPGVSVTASGLPVVVTPGQTARLTTHWHVADCAHPPAWNGGSGSLRINARMAGSGVAPSKALLGAILPAGLVAEMMGVACGQ